MQRNLSANCASYVSVLDGSWSIKELSYLSIQVHYAARFNLAHVIIPALLRSQKYNVALFRFSINKNMMLRKDFRTMHV